jgi:predicted dienelactone hydrolase
MLLGACAGENRGPDCDLSAGAEDSGPGTSTLLKDNRVRAVFAMAPAVGPGITPESLSDISIPVSIFAAVDDELLQPELNAKYYASHIPDAHLSLLPAGVRR